MDFVPKNNMIISKKSKAKAFINSFMKKLLYFDTNMLYGKPSPNLFKQLGEHNFVCFTSEIVIDELKGQAKRKMAKDVATFLKAKEEGVVKKIYKVSKELDLQQFNEKSDSDIDNYSKSIFGNNIITINNKAEAFDTLIERNEEKKPPFGINPKSDAGFCDTLIWFLFIQCCVDRKQDFTDFYFASYDDDFLHTFDILREEFYSKVGKYPTLFYYKGITQALEFLNGNQEDNKVKEINGKADAETFSQYSLQEYKSRISEILDKFMFVDQSDDENGNDYKTASFYIRKKLSFNDAKFFLDSLLARENAFLFFNKVDISTILDEIGIESRKGVETDIQNVLNLISLWKDINSKGEDVCKAFVYYFQFILNSKLLKGPEDDDLPF